MKIKGTWKQSNEKQADGRMERTETVNTQEYMEYVRQVLAILDDTKVPAIFDMAHTLTGASHEMHACILNITIMESFLMLMTPKEAAEIVEHAVTAAFVKMFTVGQAVN